MFGDICGTKNRRLGQKVRNDDDRPIPKLVVTEYYETNQTIPARKLKGYHLLL